MTYDELKILYEKQMNVHARKMIECKKQIKELQEDVRFLRSVLALALEHNSVVYREKEVPKDPRFALDENIEGEMIIRLIS